MHNDSIVKEMIDVVPESIHFMVLDSPNQFRKLNETYNKPFSGSSSWAETVRNLLKELMI